MYVSNSLFYGTLCAFRPFGSSFCVPQGKARPSDWPRADATEANRQILEAHRVSRVAGHFGRPAQVLSAKLEVA
jgi:hypothetical protein